MNTLRYARTELKKYFNLVTGSSKFNIRFIVDEKGNDFDDEIEISVVSGKGYIKGSNERSILIGVYKLFYELGCRFVRPGKNGEIIVKRNIKDITVNKFYKPQSRYRAICSEGAISEENIIDMVEWLPKVGMNSYFMQFVDGHLFFEKWYAHKNSSVLKPEKYSVAKSRKHHQNALKVIKKCGLLFQAVGHGWTTEPLGYVTYGDTCATEKDVKPEHRELFAKVKGKRAFFEYPGNTQLCYSNPKARGVITDGITNYLEKNNKVDILHFWLADSLNNHCECEECIKMLPSEWYVTMLNELDEKLTAKGIKTKVVFLIYCDLLFAPQKVKIKNPDRFIMMYAPIARSFFEPLFTAENLTKATDAPKYKRNENWHPKTTGQYLYYLKEWQKVVDCDSFSFDYHLMTFLCGGEQGGDASSIRVSKTIYEDMKGLDGIGLNGNVSCQLQRTFMPTSLPNYVMAECLFGTDRSYDEIEEENLSASFGWQWKKVRDFLYVLENFYLSDYMMGKAELKEHRQELNEFINKFKVITDTIKYSDDNQTVNQSLENLKYFVEMQSRFLSVLLKKADGINVDEDIKLLDQFVDENELKVQPYEDSLFRKDGLKTWLS